MRVLREVYHNLDQVAFGAGVRDGTELYVISLYRGLRAGQPTLLLGGFWDCGHFLAYVSIFLSDRETKLPLRAIETRWNHPQRVREQPPRSTISRHLLISFAWVCRMNDSFRR